MFKKIKTVLAVLLMALTIFSVLFPVVEADHDCCGEDCAICYVIQVAEENLKLLKVAAVLFAVAGFTFAVSKKVYNQIKICCSNPSTLISQKIRINS